MSRLPLSPAGRWALGVSLCYSALALVGLFVPAVADLLWGGPAGLALAALAPFPVDPDLQATAIAYRNRRLIADDVLPRVGVAKQSYEYNKWSREEGFTIPDTRVGRTSAPTQIEFSALRVSSTTRDYALDDPIPNADIENAPTGVDPRARATEGLTDLILLDREVRVASAVFNAAAYAAANKKTLSGTSQWSDAGSDPIAEIGAALDAPLVRPNVLVVGQAVWTKLRQHQKIIQATNMIGGATAGMASRQAVAELFELEEILVGEAFLNTAKKGQAATFARVWGKHALLMYRDRLADPARSASRVTYGFTAQFGDRIAGAIEDRDIGMRGGVRVRVGESVDEHIVAADVAYLFVDAVA